MKYHLHHADYKWDYYRNGLRISARSKAECLDSRNAFISYFFSLN